MGLGPTVIYTIFVGDCILLVTVHHVSNLSRVNTAVLAFIEQKIFYVVSNFWVAISAQLGAYSGQNS